MDGAVGFSEISAAVLKLSGVVFSIDDAYSFLSNPNPEKSNATRFICWMIVFKLASPSHTSWATDLFARYQNYQLLMTKLSNPLNPLASIPSERESRTISSDIFRGMASFKKRATDLNLSPFLTMDAERRVVRILVLMSLTFPGLDYTQSYDRYCFTNYLLTLDFCSQTSLPPAFAEAMCFRLSYEWLNIAEVSKSLQNPNSTELHFDKMDQQLMRIVPALMAPLRAAGQGSIHFAFRWELLCFADEHAVKPLLLIWDHILLHRNDFRPYLGALCFGHVHQIPTPGPHDIVGKKLQTLRDWPVWKVFTDGEIIAKHPSQA
jgi:hypothetical protein